MALVGEPSRSRGAPRADPMLSSIPIPQRCGRWSLEIYRLTEHQLNSEETTSWLEPSFNCLRALEDASRIGVRLKSPLSCRLEKVRSYRIAAVRLIGESVAFGAAYGAGAPRFDPRPAPRGRRPAWRNGRPVLGVELPPGGQSHDLRGCGVSDGPSGYRPVRHRANCSHAEPSIACPRTSLRR